MKRKTKIIVLDNQDIDELQKRFVRCGIIRLGFTKRVAREFAKANCEIIRDIESRYETR